MRKTILFVALFGSALVLSGCGKEPAAEVGEAAAKVNGTAIAATQVQAELAKLGQVPAGQAGEVANRILKNIVDQELLAQRAVQSKLDAQPDILVKMAAARRQILAEAQIDALTKNAGQPGETEIKAYFEAHPELFSQRRIYKLQELTVAAEPGNVAEVAKLAAQARSPREFAAAVQARGLPVSVREVVRAAEDLPSELLVKVSQMKTGQTLTQTQDGKFILIILVASEARTVDLQQASPMIGRYLQNSGKREKVEAELEKLRGQAKIEYVSPYSGIQAAKEIK